MEKTDFEKQASDLDKLQIDFNRACNFNGPLQRTPSYWVSWVKKESLYSYVLKDGEKVVGYISLGPKKREETTLSVKDFLCVVKEENREESIWNIFSTLVTQAIPALESDNKELISKVTHIVFPKVIVPSALAPSLQDGEFSDDGFMYQAFSAPETLNALSNTEKHVFWDVDNF